MSRLGFRQLSMFTFGMLFSLSTLNGQTVTRSGTTVTAVGTSAADVVVATFTAPNSVTITMNGNTFSYSRAQVRLLVVNLGDGADSFVGTTCPFALEVNGGGGDDTITGGKSADALAGDSGNDTILGGPGIDSCEGGAGNDFIDAGQDNDGLDGGNGRDVLVGGGGADAMNGGSAEDLLIGGFLSAASRSYVTSTWFDTTKTFDARLLQFSLVPPIVVQDPLADFIAGGVGRDLFLANIVPPVELDELIDFIDGVDADYSDLLPPTF